jgi:hypothetical protein
MVHYDVVKIKRHIAIVPAKPLFKGDTIDIPPTGVKGQFQVGPGTIVIQRLVSSSPLNAGPAIRFC